MAIIIKMIKAYCRKMGHISQHLEEREYNDLHIGGRDIPAENIMEDRGMED
jgi:hypothetical protein